jgi:hypothetical protein
MADQTLARIRLFSRSVVLQLSRRPVAQVEEAEDNLHTDTHNDPSARRLYKREGRVARMKTRNRPQIAHTPLRLGGQPRVP